MARRLSHSLRAGLLVYLLCASSRGDSTLCRLDFFPTCDAPVAHTRLSEYQKDLLRQWAQRYSSLKTEGPALMLAFSDLPRFARYEIFIADGRPLARGQVIRRLAALGIDAESHAVLRPLLAVMGDAFGGERFFYAGLERAIHRLLALEPSALGDLRRQIASQLSG